MLIDASYFFGDIQIGQLSEQSVQDTLNFFILQYEPRVLERLLGYETYKKIADANETGPEWEELRSGKDYTGPDGKLYRWRGLANNATKVSLIAYYVYCMYMENSLTATGGAGEGKIVMQNAIATSPAHKILKAWNLMVDENKKLFHFLNSNREIYVDYLGVTFENRFLFQPVNQFGI